MNKTKMLLIGLCVVLMVCMVITPAAFAQGESDLSNHEGSDQVKVDVSGAGGTKIGTEKIDPNAFSTVNATSSMRGTRTWSGTLTSDQGSMSAPAVWLNAGQGMTVAASWTPASCTFRVGVVNQSSGVFYYASTSGGSLTATFTPGVGGYYYPAVQNMGPYTASFTATATW